MALLRLTDRTIGIASLAVLARLLTPQDFGLVGFALVTVGLLELVSAFGVDIALIREPDTSRAHFDTAWTIEAVKGLTLGAAVFALAGPASDFFATPAVEPVMRWVAVCPLLAGLENIGIVNFQKDLEFRRQFLFAFTARAVGTVITIALALAWRSYWVLVVGMVARAMLRLGLSYAMHPYRPRFSLARFREIFDFSKWMFVQHLVHGLNERGPPLLVGRMAGAEMLAFFNIGREVADLGTTELRAPIRRALFPGLAQMASDRGDLARGFKESLGLIVLVTLPVPVGIGLVAAPLVRLFLGPDWVAVVPVLEVLAVAGAINTLATSSHLVYWTINRPGITAALSGLRLALLVPLLLWLVDAYGVIGAAWALAASLLAILVVDYAVILRVLSLQMPELVARIWRSVTATAVMTAAVFSVQTLLPWSESPAGLMLQLGVCGATGAASYSVAVLMLWIASGRPAGPEPVLIRLVGEFVASAVSGIRSGQVRPS